MFNIIAIATANPLSPAGGVGQAPAANSASSLLLLAGFMLVCYFMIWRPQSKRAKEHKQLLGNLHVGDEVVTGGGLLGKIAEVQDDILALTISDGVQVRVQKGAVVTMLPKGTLEGAHKHK